MFVLTHFRRKCPAKQDHESISLIDSWGISFDIPYRICHQISASRYFGWDRRFYEKSCRVPLRTFWRGSAVCRNRPGPYPSAGIHAARCSSVPTYRNIEDSTVERSPEYIRYPCETIFMGRCTFLVQQLLHCHYRDSIHGKSHGVYRRSTNRRAQEEICQKRKVCEKELSAIHLQPMFTRNP